MVCLQVLDACLPQSDPICSGIVDGSLIDKCGGQCKKSWWNSGLPCSEVVALVVQVVLVVLEVVLVVAVLAGDWEGLVAAVSLEGLVAVVAAVGVADTSWC